jgi:hypothetical protein
MNRSFLLEQWVFLLAGSTDMKYNEKRNENKKNG